MHIQAVSREEIILFEPMRSFAVILYVGSLAGPLKVFIMYQNTGLFNSILKQLGLSPS